MFCQSMMLDIKNKTRTYGYKVYNNFRDLNLPEDDIECESYQAFLLILYFYTKTNVTYEYI